MSTTTATKPARVTGVGGRPPSRLPGPDLIADDRLAELLAEYQRMTEQRRKADRDAVAARDRGPAARKADQADQAAAMRDGKADPGDAHERQRMDDLKAARSRIEATDAARLAVAREIQVRRLEVRDELLAGLDAQRAELDAQVRDALGVLAGAVEEVKRHRQLRQWIEPRTLDTYSPPRSGRGDPAVQVGTGGMAYEPRQVLEALAAALHS